MANKNSLYILALLLKLVYNRVITAYPMGENHHLIRSILYRAYKVLKSGEQIFATAS